MPSICLNMIVKNEAHVILRALASAKPLIDAWVIVDTGSTDGTQDLIRDFLSDVPGQLYERPWVNFGHNRNEALQLARVHGDYVLILDADNIFEYPEHFKWPVLKEDCYHLNYRYGDHEYSVTTLVKSACDWQWRGVIHEYFDLDGAYTTGQLNAPHVKAFHDGARAHDPQTYLKDIAILEDAVRQEPDNHRYQFYLAQSYRDAHLHAQALAAYQRRAQAGGWEEEAWYAEYQAAACCEVLQYEPQAVISAYLQAWERRPTRSEPLYALTRYLRLQERYHLAAMIAEHGLPIDKPTGEVLFLDHTIYSWRLAEEYAVVASFIPGKRYDAYRMLQVMLLRGLIPAGELQRVQANYHFLETNCPPLPNDRKPVALTLANGLPPAEKLNALAKKYAAKYPMSLIRVYADDFEAIPSDYFAQIQGVHEWRRLETFKQDQASLKLGRCFEVRV